MQVTTLAAIKGSLPEHNANLERDIESNRNGGAERLLMDIMGPDTPLVIIGSHDTAVVVNGKPGEPIFRLPFLEDK